MIFGIHRLHRCIASQAEKRPDGIRRRIPAVGGFHD